MTQVVLVKQAEGKSLKNVIHLGEEKAEKCGVDAFERNTETSRL